MTSLINSLNFKSKILVFGDVILDRWLHGTTYRHTSEFGVTSPIIDVQSCHDTLGGAGNVVRHLIGVGAEVSFIGLVGKDPESEVVNAQFSALKNCSGFLIIDPVRPTSAKIRVIRHEGQEQFYFRYDHESREPIREESVRYIEEIPENFLHDLDCVILSDYNKGVITLESIQKLRDILARQGQFNVPIIVDPKGQDLNKYIGSTLIKLNREEHGQLLVEQAKKMFPVVIATEGVKGLTVYYSGMHSLSIPSLKVEVSDCVGCGDATIAGIALAISSHFDPIAVAKVGNVFGAAATQTCGTTTPISKFLLKKVLDENPDYWS